MKFFLIVAVATLSYLTTLRAGTILEAKTALPLAPQGVGRYVSIFGGANVYQTADIPSLGFPNRDLDAETGWTIGLKAGYVFNPPCVFRPALELEASFVNNDFRADGSRQTATFREHLHDSQEVHLLPVLINGLVKINLGRWQPYVGGGLGFSYLRRDQPEVTDLDLRLKDGFRFANGSKEEHLHGESHSHFGHTDAFSFAAQGLAGVEYLCTPHLGLYVEYKALWVQDALNLDNYINHLVTGGVRLYF